MPPLPPPLSFSCQLESVTGSSCCASFPRDRSTGSGKHRLPPHLTLAAILLFMIRPCLDGWPCPSMAQAARDPDRCDYAPRTGLVEPYGRRDGKRGTCTGREPESDTAVGGVRANLDTWLRLAVRMDEKEGREEGREGGRQGSGHGCLLPIRLCKACLCVRRMRHRDMYGEGRWLRKSAAH